jgi:predicted TIM-barrel fold metal-dependent hydrolase
VERVDRLRPSDPTLGVDGEVHNEGWVFDGKVDPLHATGVRRADGKVTSEHRFDLMRPGCYDPVARLADMDQDRVSAAMCFPTMPGFSGTKFSTCSDPELGLACIRAYNDWLFEEWVAAAPGRYIPLILIPLWDVRLAVDELERNLPRGARAIAFSEDPYHQGFPSLHDVKHWFPLFTTAAEAGLPLCMHMGGSSHVLAHREDRPWFTNHSMCYMNSQMCLADWLTSGQLAQHPELKICISEGGIGWIPHLLHQLDLQYELYPEWAGASACDRPSAYFRQHVYGCFIDDPIGARLLDVIGVDNVMAETDYPHGDSTWPHSHERLVAHISHLPPEDQYKIARGNAERLFSFIPSGLGAR